MAFGLRNMQTRYLSSTWGHSAPFSLLEPNLEEAQEQLERLPFASGRKMWP